MIDDIEAAMGSRKKKSRAGQAPANPRPPQQPAGGERKSWWSWLKTPLGAVIGGVTTIVVTVVGAYLTTATTGAGNTKLDQLSDGPWLRYSVLPVDPSQIGFVSKADPGTPSLSTVDRKEGVDLEETMFKIQVTGLARSGVRIYDGRIRVRKRTEPLVGVVYLPIPPQGGAETIGLTADLDEEKPGLRDGDDGKHPLYFRQHDVTLAFGEHVMFTMTARADSNFVEWDIELRLQRDGDAEQSTMIVDDKGKPWTTSGVRAGMRGYTAAYEETDFDSWRRIDDVSAFCRTEDKLKRFCGGGK